MFKPATSSAKKQADFLDSLLGAVTLVLTAWGVYMILPSPLDAVLIGIIASAFDPGPLYPVAIAVVAVTAAAYGFLVLGRSIIGAVSASAVALSAYLFFTSPLTAGIATPARDIVIEGLKLGIDAGFDLLGYVVMYMAMGITAAIHYAFSIFLNFARLPAIVVLGLIALVTMLVWLMVAVVTSVVARAVYEVSRAILTALYRVTGRKPPVAGTLMVVTHLYVVGLLTPLVLSFVPLAMINAAYTILSNTNVYAAIQVLNHTLGWIIRGAGFFIAMMSLVIGTLIGIALDIVFLRWLRGMASEIYYMLLSALIVSFTGFFFPFILDWLNLAAIAIICTVIASPPRRLTRLYNMLNLIPIVLGWDYISSILWRAVQPLLELFATLAG